MAADLPGGDQIRGAERWKQVHWVVAIDENYQKPLVAWTRIVVLNPVEHLKLPMLSSHPKIVEHNF